MIVAINQQPYDGPWGGGNRFLQAIVKGLEAQRHHVVHHLSGDVDIILMVETRVRSPNVTFGAGAILRYLLGHPHTVVVHRVNECDERKGEKFITHKLLRANYAADLTVFVGSWLKELPAWTSYDASRSAVILNGADKEIFHAGGFVPWNGQGPIRLVTHHWGCHPFKGFDVYEHIDRMLDDPDFSQKFSMTYIGNVAQNYSFKNIRVLSPLNGHQLADNLRMHHAYITGSISEPGGNHQNEGAACGLPIVYRNSGCMPEYCGAYGIGYDDPDGAVRALYTLRDNYDQYVENVKLYPHTADFMVKNWMHYFDDVYRRREDIVARRKVWRDPYLFFRNQIPV